MPPQTIQIAVGSKNPCKIEAVRKAFEEVFCRDNIAGESDPGDCDGTGGGSNLPNEKSRVRIVISAYNVPSGVSDQPFGDAETREGAMNRAKAAFDAAYADTQQYPDFAIGLEGGLEKGFKPPYFSQTKKQQQSDPSRQHDTDELWCMAWMAILGSNSDTCTAAKAEGSTYSKNAPNGIITNKNNDQTSSESSDIQTESEIMWGYAKTGSFLLPPALCELVLHQNMELGHADDMVFRRVNSKHGSGTVGVLTDGEIDRMEYYVHALKLALIPWIRPELYIG